MILHDPVVVWLDPIEDWATRTLASWGWRLDRRKPWNGQPTSTGWEFTQLGVGSSDEHFRVDMLTRWTKTRHNPKQDEETDKHRSNLRKVMIAIWAAREALNQGNASASLAIGMQFQRYVAEFDIPAIHAEGDSLGQAERGRKGGLKSKKPPNPLTPMLDAITAEINSYDTDNVLAWWEDLTSPTSAMGGLGGDYECFYDMDLYHFYLDGEHEVTKREIQQSLSNIRRAQR